MRPAPLQQPVCRVAKSAPPVLKAGDPFPIGERALVDEERDHADLATFGPCNKGISLV